MTANTEQGTAMITAKSWELNLGRAPSKEYSEAKCKKRRNPKVPCRMTMGPHRAPAGCVMVGSFGAMRSFAAAAFFPFNHFSSISMLK